MQLIGHRGCHYPGYNQNTIRAFEKVTSEGVAAIEFDVQVCSDGELVVIHNLDLEEVSTGTGKVLTTDSRKLKTYYAGDPQRGRDRIPFLSEVFDFFASLKPERRPAIHMELKGDDTGLQAGKLLNDFVSAGMLRYSDVLASSFNWQELTCFRDVCPQVSIALLDGAIRRKLLLEKTGPDAEHYFEKVFAYGCEQYMLPRFSDLPPNMELLTKECPDRRIREIIMAEITDCLAGRYYTDKLIRTACEMKASSVNLWYRTVTSQFIEKAHASGLAVLVYTINIPDELLAAAQMGVDGIFTDYYAQATEALTDFL